MEKDKTTTETSVLSRRERNLMRELQWVMGLWKLNLPQTKETLEFIYFLRDMEIKEYTRNILSKQATNQNDTSKSTKEANSAKQNCS